MIGPDGYGDAEIVLQGDRLVVGRADDIIGISVELLAEQVGWGLRVDGDGLLLLAGDPAYRYRPVRFVAKVDEIEPGQMLYVPKGEPGQAVEGTRVLVCERVR